VVLAVGTSLLAHHFPPDGRTHGSLPQFLGRFHPLIVHLPIGLVLLVPVLELAGAWGRKPDLRSAAGWVLTLGAAAAVVAAFDGWLLAWSSGYSGPLVKSHQSAGIYFAELSALAALYRAWPGGQKASRLTAGAYALLLGLSIGTLCWASHLGGQITHGNDYLSEYMPGRLKAWLGVKEPAPAVRPKAAAQAEPTLFAAKINPILQRSCVSCHNPKKFKGELRMDSYAELMKGGKGGEEIEPWHPQDSELVRRITLPDDDDDHMPSNGKNPLSAAEIKLIEDWIGAGATDTQPAVQ
jgi:uncharacterized membrane protein